MKRWAFFFIIAIVIYGVSQTPEEKAATALPQVDYKNFPTKKYPPVPHVIPTPREPATIKAEVKEPPKIEVSYGETPLKIGKSYLLVEDMLAVPKSQYQPHMGTKITENNQFVFFKPGASIPEAWPVARDQSSERFFPISHVLHVKGVDAALREELRGFGLNEFYYHSRLKFISLEATPSTVLTHYQELLSKGHDAQLEVLKDPHQAK